MDRPGILHIFSPLPHVKTQQALLRSMLETEQPVYLDFVQAFRIARSLV